MLKWKSGDSNIGRDKHNVWHWFLLYRGCWWVRKNCSSGRPANVLGSLFTSIQLFYLHAHMFKFTLTHAEHQVWTQRTNETVLESAAWQFEAMSSCVYCPLPRLQPLVCTKNQPENKFGLTHCKWSVWTELLSRLGRSLLICCGDYNKDKFNCWWQIKEPAEDLTAAVLPREQLEEQSSILLLLKSFLSLIKTKKIILIQSEIKNAAILRI